MKYIKSILLISLFFIAYDLSSQSNCQCLKGANNNGNSNEFLPWGNFNDLTVGGNQTTFQNETGVTVDSGFGVQTGPCVGDNNFAVINPTITTNCYQGGSNFNSAFSDGTFPGNGALFVNGGNANEIFCFDINTNIGSMYCFSAEVYTDCCSNGMHASVGFNLNGTPLITPEIVITNSGWKKSAASFSGTGSAVTLCVVDAEPAGYGNDWVLDNVSVFEQGSGTDKDNDGVFDESDLDADNDGILDSQENGSTNSTINMTGDFTDSNTGGYPISVSYNIPNQSGNNGFEYVTNVTTQVVLDGCDVLNKCELLISTGVFDDGLQLAINGNQILYFNQRHWGTQYGANTTEFNVGGIFDTDNSGSWTPWTGEGNPELSISQNGIQLLVTTISGIKEDAIPYMDDTKPNWVFNNVFSYDCIAGIETEFGNANDGGPGSLNNANITVNAYIAKDTDCDGIGDIFDLDSDNDGIPDAIEACGNTNLNLENCALDTDNSETYNLDENDCSTGVVTNSGCNILKDSDNDGTPDYVDLDSDNDGCSDAEEAGTNSFYGVNFLTFSDPAVNTENCGLVVSAQNGVCIIPTNNNWVESSIYNICNPECVLTNLNADCDNDGIINYFDCDPLDASNDASNLNANCTSSSVIFDFGN